MKSSDDDNDDDLHNLLLNLCPFDLDPCCPPNSQSASVNPGPSSCVHPSTNQFEMASLPSPDCLVNFLSFNKFQKDSQQEFDALPGASDMFIIPLPQCNIQGACLTNKQNGVPEYEPDGTDVPKSSHSLGDNTFLCNPQNSAHTHHPVKPAIGMGTPYQHRSAGIESHKAMKEQLARNADLESRACRLRKRLKTLLGEHAVSHCSQQLDRLKNQCHQEDVSHDCQDSIEHSPQFSCKEMSADSPFFENVREFSQCSQTLLKGLQEDLDTEATSCSSSTEDYEEDRMPFVSCEKQWLEEKAELRSRWCWLQLRLDELEGRIQQLDEIHKHIRATKGGVVLAQAQPLTDWQIQNTLMKEMAGLSGTNEDLDTESCSPTQLLQNIERQSAQLNLIVNSLIPPLNLSPVSKQNDPSKWKKALTSFQSGEDGFVPGCSNRKKPCTRRLCKKDIACVSARTRPIASYHKRKLFYFNNNNPQPLNLREIKSSSSCFLSSSSCSCSSSLDPVALCSDPNCCSNSVLWSNTSSVRPHSATALSSDSSTSLRSEKVRGREEWCQKPLVVNSDLCSSPKRKRNNSTSRHNRPKYKQQARHRKKKVMGLSPNQSFEPILSDSRRSNRRRRKRKHVQKMKEGLQESVDEAALRMVHKVHKESEEALPRRLDLGESSEGVKKDSCTPVTDRANLKVFRGKLFYFRSYGDLDLPQQKHKIYINPPTLLDGYKHGFGHKRRKGKDFNIDDVVIPMTCGKVEKLAYKDIVTPSWRVVEIQPLPDSEEDDDEIEDISDEVFAQRHSILEQNEKLRWSIDAIRERNKRPMRSQRSVNGMCPSGEESSVEWSSAQQENLQPAEENLQPEDSPTWSPWERRVFPLNDAEDAALYSEEEDATSLPRPESSSASHPPKSFTINTLTYESDSDAPPPDGQS